MATVNINGAIITAVASPSLGIRYDIKLPSGLTYSASRIDSVVLGAIDIRRDPEGADVPALDQIISSFAQQEGPALQAQFLAEIQQQAARASAVEQPEPVPEPVPDVDPATRTDAAGQPATGPASVPEYVAQQDPEGGWAVYDLSTGLPVRTGLSEQEAQLAAEDLNVSGEVQQRPAPVNQTLEQQAEYEAAKENTLRQAALQARYKQPSNSDWRVRIQLSAQSDYLYNAPDPGILKPLKDSNGVVFPYTPNIETSYKANYERYDLTHSNYRGLFYRNSSVDDISVRGTFTAQDSKEAEYLLAVIHFFRSVTKMFYGQDAQRGAPPPIVYLTGLGDFQFAGHPCVVSNFSYSLPSDVDYIRANNFNLYGSDTLNQRVQSNGPSTTAADRIRKELLAQVGVPTGAVPKQPIQSQPTRTVNNTQRATYVPTKMEINISMIPVQTRDQLSKQFSLKEFANGKLLNGGFW